MTRLVESLRAWQTEAFGATVKRELLELPPGVLPLQAGVTRGGYADARDLEISVLDAMGSATAIMVNIGVFFTEIIANCGCGDDPVPEPAYCRMQVVIDRRSGDAGFFVQPE